MNKAQPIGVASDHLSIMLWPNAQRRLSSSLKNMSVTLQVQTSAWKAGIGDELVIPPQMHDPSAVDRVLPAHVTPLDYNDIGELINESEIVSNGKGSAGFSIKGNHPEKDGIAPGLLAAKAVQARSTSFNGQSPLTGDFSSSHLGGIRISENLEVLREQGHKQLLGG